MNLFEKLMWIFKRPSVTHYQLGLIHAGLKSNITGCCALIGFTGVPFLESMDHVQAMLKQATEPKDDGLTRENQYVIITTNPGQTIRYGALLVEAGFVSLTTFKRRRFDQIGLITLWGKQSTIDE